ncbi:MAG: DUF2284 domain-containing protein [Clostridiales bacterium]|nr:DUF2284 domain-containing protein [Clostridiales bacterium]
MMERQEAGNILERKNGMTEWDMCAAASKEDFTKVSLIDMAQIVIHQDYRLYCEENRCGNYNRNYGCPPDCGTAAEMENRARQYRRALVMQTCMEVDDVEDQELLREIRKEHNRKSRSVAEQFRKAGISGLMMQPGPCSFCKECRKIKGEPCPFPEHRTSCLSAYGVDVTALAESCGMRLDWDGGSISYFSLFLYDRSPYSE